MSLADFSSVSDAGGPAPGWLTIARVAALLPPAMPRSLVMPPPLPSLHYLLRHWRGASSLPIAYWVNGALVGIGFVVALVVLFVLCCDLLAPRPQTYFRLFSATYASIVIVAIW